MLSISKEYINSNSHGPSVILVNMNLIASNYRGLPDDLTK